MWPQDDLYDKKHIRQQTLLQRIGGHQETLGFIRRAATWHLCPIHFKGLRRFSITSLDYLEVLWSSYQVEEISSDAQFAGTMKNNEKHLHRIPWNTSWSPNIPMKHWNHQVGFSPPIIIKQQGQNLHPAMPRRPDVHSSTKGVHLLGSPLLGGWWGCRVEIFPLSGSYPMKRIVMSGKW